MCGRDSQETEYFGRDNGALSHRRRAEPTDDAESAGLHEARRQHEHGDAHEKHQIGRGHIGERAQGGSRRGVGQRGVGEARRAPFGGDQVQQRHDVGPRLNGIGGGRLRHELDVERRWSGWEPDQAGHHPAP